VDCFNLTIKYGGVVVNAVIHKAVGSETHVIDDSYILTLSNPIFLPPAYSPALVYFGRKRGWWVICNYLTVLKEKNINENRNS
jgi:hypothetical protein